MSLASLFLMVQPNNGCAIGWEAHPNECRERQGRADCVVSSRGYHKTGETEPFPYGDDRFGAPLRDDLSFLVLEKDL
jgi:hypothetical protein